MEDIANIANLANGIANNNSGIANSNSESTSDSKSAEDTLHKLTAREIGNRNLRPFVKGDVRINRKGRPKTFDQWRELVQEILQEPAIDTDQRGVPLPGGRLTLIQIPKVDKDGQPVVDKNGQAVMVDHYATNAELLARKWLRTKDHQQGLVDAGFGKVPTAVDITSGGRSLVRELPDDEKLRRLETLTRKALGVGPDVIDVEVIHSADELASTSPSSIAQDVMSDESKS